MPTTKGHTVRLAEGAIRIPAGLRVKKAPSFQLCPRDGVFMLDEFPEDIFPQLSSRRRWAESALLINAGDINP
jgi:hypothetical protein